MTAVSTYLNFTNKTEEAFNFYKSVFGGEFTGDIQRFKDVPPAEDMPPLPEEDKDLIMHIELSIIGGHKLMGTDAPESMGFKVTPGNNVYLMIEPDTRAEADKLFNALSEGGTIETPMQEMFWGGYYGSFADRYGVQWMLNIA
ncbi:MAG: VOC family protein [Thermoleophilia bacterium]|nr:VOC family protein [Thermoleophilia bacterium]